MKHIVYKAFGIIIMISALAMSCSKASQSEYEDGDKTFLPVGDIMVHSIGDELVFTYTADSEWEVGVVNRGEQKGWISARRQQSEVYIYVDPFSKSNLSSENQREAEIVFSSLSGNRLDSFTITQERLIFDVDFSEEHSYPAWIDSDCKPIIVTITKGAVPESSLDWIDLKLSDSDSTKDTDRYIVLPKHNANKEQRAADMTLECKATKDVSDKISIIQSGFEFNLSDEEFDFNEIPEDVDKREVSLTCSGEWVVNAPDWIRVTDNSGNSISEGKGNAEIYVNVTVNPSINERRDYLIINVKEIDVKSESISVSQKGYIWKVEGDNGLSYSIASIPSSSISFDVSSSGKWITSYNSEVLKVSPEQSAAVTATPQKVTVMVQPNYSTAERTIDLLISSEHYRDIQDDANDLRDKIQFKQSRYMFNISEDRVILGAASNSTQSIPVTCSGKLKDASVEDAGKEWLEAIVDGQNIQLTAKQDNGTGAERSARVTITCEHTENNPNLKIELTVTQSNQ